MIRSTIIALCLLLSASGATAGELAIRRFQLADQQSLVLPMPDAWQVDVLAPEKQQPTVLRIRAKAGSGFELQLAPSLPMAGKSAKPAPGLRQRVRGMAKAAHARAIGHASAIQSLKTAYGKGYYFSASLEPPRSDHYNRLTQGVVPIGDRSLTFTLRTDDDGQAIVDATLLLIGDSRLEPTPASAH